ncbi:MAG TPA: serine/threonine-protein kinase, partial [Gemmataceae bacterium]|nr:serine/threonine-protein kinase [Gemmataceae bacterium]
MAPEEQDLPAQSLNEPISLFPDSGVPASDDAPTIISKNQQSRNGSSHEALLNGSLRGRTLAHFELIEPIGVGGMAAVIRARDKHLDRPVALKILPPEMAADPENVRRFHQEARAAAKLDHENIARVFFCGEDQRLHFIAFEFVEGLNLRHLLERRGRLPVPEAVHYMLQIATGLAHAASRGVVHRDIKPSNIIISPNGRAKLVDMGLARHLGPHDDKALTQSGVTLGTFDYIAPEQAMDPRDADVRSDIYSLGCTFYHMLTGQPPVPEGTAAKKLHHHQHVAPVDPRQLNPDIPDDVAAVLVRMMAKDPKDRYQRAEHLVQHLLQVAQKLGASTDLPDGVLFVDAPLPTPPRKRPLLTVALAILGLGLVLLVLSFAPGPNRVRPTRNPQAPAEVKSTPTVEKTPVQDQKKEVEPPPLAGSRKIITSERELREALADTTNHLHLLLDVKDISITKVGLLIRGRSDRTIVIESKDKEPKNWATLHITPGQALDGKPWAGLELQGGIVTFRNLRFELDARETPKSLLAGVLVKGARQVIFKDCTFVQPNVPLLPLIRRQGLTPIASVAALNPDETSDEKPRLEFEECYFERGQTAVALVSAADVIAVNCAFGDHVALFHLGGQGHTRPR